MLHNSELTDGVSVTYRNSPIEVDDCDIYVLDAINCSRVDITGSNIWDIVLWNIGYVELVNSSVDVFNLMNDDICEVVLNQCFIGRFDAYVSYFYKLSATDSVIVDFYQGRRAEMVLNGMKVALHAGDMEYLSISGDFNLENNTLPTLVFGRCLNANLSVCRVFPVFVQNLNVPIEDALVEILDWYEVVTSTRTDDYGYARITLGFFERYRYEKDKLLHDTNISKSYTLRIVYHGSEYVKKVGVYTITPIIVEVESSVDKTVLMSIAVFCLLLIFVFIRKASKR